MNQLVKRLDKLETANRSGVVVMWRHHTETDEQAKARWRTEHPDEDPERAALNVIIVKWAGGADDAG